MNQNIIKIKNGFTIIELMVVVVIVGLMAAFAIPNYQKSIRKSNEKTAIQQLEIMYEANQLYYAKEGDFIDGSDEDVSYINSGLNISLTTSDMAFNYNKVAPDTYTATMTYSEGATEIFEIEAVGELDLKSGNPCCSSGTCTLIDAC